MGPIALKDRWPRERRGMKPENSWEVHALNAIFSSMSHMRAVPVAMRMQHRLDQMPANLSIESAPGRSMSLL